MDNPISPFRKMFQIGNTSYPEGNVTDADKAMNKYDRFKVTQ